VAIESAKPLPDMYNRVIATLEGKKADRLPFIDRMELWYSSHSRAGTLPERYQAESADAADSVLSVFTVPIPKGTKGMTAGQIHRDLGFGQQIQMICHARRLHGVELILKLEGETYYHETNPVIEYFPRLFSDLQRDKAGEQTAEFITPVGTLTTKTILTPEVIEMGGVPLMIEHPFKDVSDLTIYEYIFERAEFVPGFEAVYQTQERLGNFGFVAAMMNRIPFQQLALDHVGEINFFYMIYDHPQVVDRLMKLFDEVALDDLRHLAAFDWPYVQFDDNLDGFITNPRLFKKYCLTYYQRYTDILHGQGKKVGSHTDGDLKLILPLLAECGLDVAESVSPEPLTGYTFDDAWMAWKDTGPMIWGGIPSPLLEAHTPEAKLHAFIDHVLETVGDRPIILGISDLVMPNNLIERVRYIAERIEQHEI
jgi:hypothetical protein